MKDQHKTKTQLVRELAELRQRVADLERVRDEQRRAEGALRGSRERLDLALNSSNGGLWDLEFSLTDSTETIPDQVYLSPVLKRFIGYDKDEFPDSITGWKSRILLEDLIGVNKAAQDHLEGKTDLYEAQYRIRHKDGSIRWIHTRGKILRDEDGKPLRWVGIDWNITEQKRSEEALRESEERYRLIFQNSLDAILLTSPDGQILTANPRACSMSGYTEAELQKIGRMGIVDPADPRLPLALEERGRTGRFKGELTLVCRDGSKFEAEISSTVFRNEDGFEQVSMIIHDLTERKWAEEVLREERDRAQKYLDVANVMFLILNIDGTVRLINKKGLEILGYKEEEVIGKYWVDNFLPERYRNELASAFRQLIAGDVEPAEYIENPVLTKSGQERMIAWHNSFVTNRAGHAVCSISSGEDITERRRAEDALKETNQNLRSIIHASPLAIVILDSDGKVLHWNPAAEQTFGWREEETLGRPHPVVPKGREEEFQRMLKSVLDGNSFHSAEVVRQKRDGAMIDLNFSSAPLIDSSGRIQGSIGIFEDISERKKAEREKKRFLDKIESARRRMQQLSRRLVELQEAERRDLSRELHDQVGQNLTGLSFNLKYIQGAVQEGLLDTIKSRINDSQKLLEKTILSIRDLMSNLRPPVLDDYGLVAALKWCGKKIMKRSGITIAIKGDEIIPRLPSEVETALFRIAQEAIHNVVKHARASEAILTIKSEKERARLVIADKGVGFDPARHEAPEAQSGLGLINMRERTHAVGGKLRVESAPGKGTKIIVEVPRKR